MALFQDQAVATQLEQSSHPVIKHENHVDLGDDDDENEYKPRPPLPQPFVGMRRLVDLIKELDAGIIDVDPEYQREIVWAADRMTGLINSLMENFYIPPIILNRKTLPSENSVQKHTLVCVDGKQRLSSVRAFVKGMIPCHDHKGEKWWFADTAHSRRKKVLPEKTRRVFLAKEFVSFEFKNLSAVQEEDLFARVQMGIQLTLAEKMRASTGPWQELARLFVDDFPTIYSLMKDRARAKDFQLTLSCFSQIVEVMYPGASDGIPMLKTNHNALPKLLSNKGAVDDGIKSHLASVWRTFKDLVEKDPDTFTNANKYLGGVQTFAPVEIVAVTVLISMYSGTRNNQLLLGDIQAMRTAFRETFVDLRLNAQVWKFTWQFLDSLEAIRGAVDGSTVIRKRNEGSKSASQTVQNGSATSTPRTAATGEHATKTKAPSISPPRQSMTVKAEPIDTSKSANIRQPKRKRTEPIPPSQSSSSTTAAIPNSNAVTAHTGQAQRNSWSDRSPFLVAVPSSYTQDSIPGRTQASQGYRQQSGPSQGPYSGFPTQSVGLNSSLPPTFQQTPPFPPGSGYTSFNTTTAFGPSNSTAHGMSTYLAGLHMQPGIVRPLSNATSQRQHSTGNIGIGRGAFNPSHTEQEWGGIIASSTPPATTTTPRVPNPRTTPNTAKFRQNRSDKSRKSVSRPYEPQVHSIIDLTSDTSDTEEERQKLQG